MLQQRSRQPERGWKPARIGDQVVRWHWRVSHRLGTGAARVSWHGWFGRRCVARQRHEAKAGTRRSAGDRSLARIQGTESGYVWFEERQRTGMLARDSRQAIVEGAQRDAAFARAVFSETLELLVKGEPDTARLLMRDLVHATTGFERLAVIVGTPSKSLHRMLSARGNPSMDNLSAILRALDRRCRAKRASRRSAA